MYYKNAINLSMNNRIKIIQQTKQFPDGLSVSEKNKDVSGVA